MSLPLRVCALYWVNWFPVYRLKDLPTAYNLIYLFQAVPVGGAPGSTGGVTYTAPSGAPGTNLNADMAICRARGQKILLTIGGAGAQLTLNTQARADVFIASIKSINVQFGGSGTTLAFDGIDWDNFEGANISGQATWMTYAGAQLKAYYGASNFLITSPPASFEFTTSGQAGTDRLLLATLYAGGALDMLSPQFYDPSDLNTTANVTTALDWYHSTVTVSGSPVTIPRNNIGIGFAIKSGSADANRWSTTTAVSCYNSMVSSGRTPRGAFNWTEDGTSGYAQTIDLFATSVAPTINPDLGGDTTAPTPGASGVITFTGVNDTGMEVDWTPATDDTTAQASLQYELRRSLSNNINSVANAEANGTIAQAYTANIGGAIIHGLSPSTTYYFNVIVKDTNGNKAVYTTNNQITTAPPGNLRNTVGMGSVTGLHTITI